MGCLEPTELACEPCRKIIKEKAEELKQRAETIQRQAETIHQQELVLQEHRERIEQLQKSLEERDLAKQLLLRLHDLRRGSKISTSSAGSLPQEERNHSQPRWRRCLPSRAPVASQRGIPRRGCAQC